MKKTPVVLVPAVFMLLSACSQNSAVPVPSAASDSLFSAVYDGVEYQCRVAYVNDGMSSITIESPESLKGLKFSRADGKSSISLGTLLCRSEKPLSCSSSLPENLFALYDAVSSGELSFTEEKNGRYTFSGTSDGSSVTVETDASGKLLKLKNENLEMINSE